MEMESSIDLGLRKSIQAHGIVAVSQRVLVADVSIRNDEYQTRGSGGGGFSHEVISDYVVAMKGGSVFPELLLVANHTNKLFVVCGAHRLLAMRTAGIVAFRALVVAAVDGDIWPLRAISAEDNNTHGVRQSSAAAVRIAASELLAMPLPAGAAEHPYAVVKVVAERYQRSPQVVKKNYYTLLAKGAIMKLGPAGKIPTGVGLGGALEKLWMHHGNTPAFDAIARATLQVGFRGQAEKILDLAKKNKTAPADIPGLILDSQTAKAGPVIDPVKNVLEAAAVLARAIGRLHGVSVGPEIFDKVGRSVAACQIVCAEWVAAQ